jgi:hypothetical protein
LSSYSGSRTSFDALQPRFGRPKANLTRGLAGIGNPIKAPSALDVRRGLAAFGCQHRAAQYVYEFLNA